MRRHWKKVVLGILFLLFGGVIFLGVIFWSTRSFPEARFPADAQLVDAWWIEPAPLTEMEIAFVRWISSITWQLPEERHHEYWDVGGSQHGIYSIRYQAAGVAYAAAVVGMRTPAYPDLTGRILANAIERLVDPRAWSYIATYWKNSSWFPDPCGGENIMYTGHLLQLLAMYEAATGDRRYHQDGMTFVWSDGQQFTYDTLSLAEVTAAQMRASASGGVPCEPGLVFFMCNNHPHIALLMLERMGYGDWEAERAKWEDWSLRRFRTLLGGGQFKLLYHQPSRAFLPVGHPGGDGWSLAWYAPWARSPRIVPGIWQRTMAHFDWEALDQSVMPGVDVRDSCCLPLDIPLASVVCFLATAARLAGDTVSAQRCDQWLDDHYLTMENGMAWLQTDPQWRIGVTGNRLLSLALAEGSDLRALVQRPLPRSYFEGPLIQQVLPASVPVYQAWRDDTALIVELDGMGGDVRLDLANLPQIITIEGLTNQAWVYVDGVLELPKAGRSVMRIVFASDE